MIILFFFSPMHDLKGVSRWPSSVRSKDTESNMNEYQKQPFTDVFKICVLKSFAILTEKTAVLCRSLFLIKLQA